MDKQKNQSLQLIILGLIIIGLSQVIRHYFEISDFYSGGFIGIGIGVMLFSILKTRKKQTS